MRKLIIIILGIFLLLVGCVEEEPPKKPSIIGVKDGEVYNSSVQIELEEEKDDVEYNAKIDGKTYNFGDSYDVEGKHTFEVIASKGEASTTTSISFEIDTTPPANPDITGVKNNEVYMKPVKIHVEEKQGISYNYKLNGNDYNLGTEIKEDGEYTFTVIATKNKNELSTKKQIKFTIDQTTYSQEAFEYFKEIAFGAEYGGSPYITKWLDDINIEIIGNPTQKDIETIQKVIDELEQLTPLTINIVENKANINMYFVPQGDFRKYIPGAVLGNWAYFRYYKGERGQINQAKIAIGTFGSDQENRNHHIREEMTQVLGLGNDSTKYKNSIFYETEAEVNNQDFSKLDKKVIEILYRPDVKVGMTEKEVTDLFKDRIRDN
ncbi:DUF2927 domain-containing protein [Filobacillus milosensis]|uniref:DUF2927 domain-containing protein n=1 Tax=Filobacillus milosensis TaxID=94137 RepID=A0A4Y8IEA2_9BACI|nr:DUF2927 domain-containing protein [Filobacillus milosensis]TFB14266.1 DUF2927 domain-containing protein [Filobacillus milosensis]